VEGHGEHANQRLSFGLRERAHICNLARDVCWSNRIGMVMVGTLIAESLRVGAVIEGIPFVTTKLARSDVGDVDASQPLTWTFIEFEVAEDDAERLALVLETSLQRPGAWYCDFRSDEETFVVFADRTFRYPRGDRAGRAEATAFGRSVGVPEGAARLARLTRIELPIGARDRALRASTQATTGGTR
jgi:hypothetical protein